jgi:hypothetical protein
MSPERKAFNLHAAMTRLLDQYKRLQKETNSEPLFENSVVDDAERALFNNRPLADWETTP